MNIIIKIENLKCHGCANTIVKGIQKFSEVEKVDVNVEDSVVEIWFEGDEDNILKFENQLSKMGYPKTGENTGFSVAKSYVSCAIGRIGK